ncbi:cyclophilin-like fold protein [Pseudomonas sp. SL4(2022)]|uniref:cyclophilin-like fold protein n=1 Tax=Pseudomonas sp. SL4(2022) TaxID=2994661 RepID=UPI00226DEA94|nr:cyclophilin-like fold protein [Pseudomonas sp. SL4(2022)]WAC43414.1 cyclophilin-like fold protein [Pseudomonas sp. SL4(2022)]
MTELNANETYGLLAQALPTRAARPGVLYNGALMVYGADTLVIFYRTFKSSYPYTRRGRVDKPDTLAEALGRDDVTVHFSAH